MKELKAIQEEAFSRSFRCMSDVNVPKQAGTNE
jgi:hypothetical protein